VLWIDIRHRHDADADPNFQLDADPENLKIFLTFIHSSATPHCFFSQRRRLIGVIDTEPDPRDCFRDYVHVALFLMCRSAEKSHPKQTWTTRRSSGTQSSISDTTIQLKVSQHSAPCVFFS
jgi:hypothetical protein